MTRSATFNRRMSRLFFTELPKAIREGTEFSYPKLVEWMAKRLSAKAAQLTAIQSFLDQALRPTLSDPSSFSPTIATHRTVTRVDRTLRFNAAFIGTAAPCPTIRGGPRSRARIVFDALVRAYPDSVTSHELERLLKEADHSSAARTVIADMQKRQGFAKVIEPAGGARGWRLTAPPSSLSVLSV